MPKTGIANLPLHGGKAPKWLFRRMVSLSQAITDIILFEYGKKALLQKLSNPFWFQALACVLAWDWHSSGATTVTCGALKEAITPEEYGLAIVGGKGKASKKTIEQIDSIGETLHISSSKLEAFKYASRMAAKIDNAAIQDGHFLYHHSFIFTEDGLWDVIQQGMNEETKYARRYHWFSERVRSYICEPNNEILGENRQHDVLNMTSADSLCAQRICVDLVKDHPRHLRRDWELLTKNRHQHTLDDWIFPHDSQAPLPSLDMPRTLNWRKMQEMYDVQPKNYEELIGLKGVGPRTIRALALIADLVYNEKASWRDPIKYTFAHGGKDGVPYPVDKPTMDESTEILRMAVAQAEIGKNEKLKALQRLQVFSHSV
jgi:hypothetical protein